MKKLVLSTFLILQVILGFAQSKTGFTGKVVESKSQKPMQDVVVTIQNTTRMQITNAEGRFTFDGLSAENYLVLIKSAGFKDQLMSVDVQQGKMIDIGIVVMDEDITDEQRVNLISITDNDLGDDNSGSETTSGLLQASRDALQQAAAFNWGQARFRLRGLSNEYSKTMINGVEMNKLYDGRPQWSNWGGLNDATRNQEFTMGSAPSDYSFGGILGTQEINTRASIYRPGTRISFAGANTNYDWRVMGTHASGMDKDGWAFVVSASRRWAEDGYFDGTTYNANSIFASVEKKLNKKHSLNFTSIYASNRRGKNSANTQEAIDMTNSKYSSYWGWQDGQKRNSRIKDMAEPVLMLNHFWKISNKTNINTSITHQLGYIGNSRLGYQTANNPDPTYYRNLPSYYTSYFNNYQDEVLLSDPTAYQPGGLGGLWTPNYAGASDPLQAKFLAQKQIDWNQLYKANSEANRYGEGAKYYLYEDRTDDKVWVANSILNSQLSDNILLNAGGNFKYLNSHNFQNMLDLLGANFYKEQDVYQQEQGQIIDMNNPLRQVVKGDHFGYDYNIYATTFGGFTQFKFTYKKVDFYLGQSFNRTQYQRDGHYVSGLYPTNSYGKSDKKEFDSFGFKGGLTYKITGRHLFNVNAVYMTQAPAIRNVFPYARLNNNATPNITGETITSADASYIIRAPKLKTRITAFYSNIKHATQTAFFFGDGVFQDDGDNNGGDAFVAETIMDIEKRNMGVELGIEYQLTSTVKVTANGSYGEYIYNNNPTVFVNNDNLASEDNTIPITYFGEAKLKNYKLAGTPQAAANFGIEYRDPKFWWIGANANYLARNYVDVSALLRTQRFFTDPSSQNGYSFSEATQERADQLLKQERLDDFFMLNMSGGKSWKIKNTTFGVFVSAYNLLNKTYKTYGFEQSRNSNYRELNQDVSSGTPAFGNKYFYGYGRNYFVNVYINF